MDDRIDFPLADGDQPVGCHALTDEIALDGVSPTLRELDVVFVGPEPVRVTGNGD